MPDDKYDIEEQINDISDEELDAERRHKKMYSLQEKILAEIKKGSLTEDKLVELIGSSNDKFIVALDAFKKSASGIISVSEKEVASLLKAVESLENTFTKEMEELKGIMAQIMYLKTCEIEMTAEEYDSRGDIKKIKIKTIAPKSVAIA
jgi:hypothetical protein